jgi:hypothetical protein
MAARKFKFVSPGVFLKEIDNSHLPKLPGGVGPVIIGRTKKGPALKPVKISSFQDYVRIFGETMPGNQGSDPWRDGNGLQASAYAPYAAQAYLAAAIQSPITVIRLAGVAGDDAIADTGNAKPGWKADGATHGLFVIPNQTSGSLATAGPTGSLVAMLYTTTGSIQVGIKGLPHLCELPSGSRAQTGVAVSGHGEYDASLLAVTNGGRVTQGNADGTFNLLINLRGDTNTTWGNGEEKKISFLPGTRNYIRDVLNTNPVKTNTNISRTVSGTLAHKYWLGETFEEEYQRVSSSAGATGVSMVALRLKADMSDFKSSNHQVSPGQTGWVFGQHHGAAAGFKATDQQKLFRAISLHEGESPSRNLLVRIENIRVPEAGAVDPYGSFAVVVLQAGGTRLEEVERFDGCNLNPNSQNFVARKVGNQYFVWSSVEKRNKIYGSHPNASDYIRIEMDQDVLEKGPDEPSSVPWGFFGPIIPITAKTDPLDIGSNAAACNNGTSFVHTNAFHMAQLGAGPVYFAFPNQPLIQNASVASPIFGASPYKMTYPARAETAILSSGYVDYCRRMSELFSAGVLADHIAGVPVSSRSKYSYEFSLDDVVVIGSTGNLLDSDLSDFTPVSVAHITGSRVLGASATATSTPAELTRNVFDTFQMPLVGGFEGVDITEADPFNMRVVNSAATTADNYAYASIDRAISLIKDPESLEMNLAVMPGITNDSLTTKLVETCESRADALAIIDLPDVYVPPFQNKCEKFEERLTTTPAKAAKALTARQLNSSYGCAYYPWVKVRDSIYTRDVWVPPSVVALGVMAYTEQRNEVWFAPAGFNRGGLNEGNSGLAVLQVTEQLLSKHRDTLYEANINPIASFVTEGLVVFGQKTLQSSISALDRINVRRLLIFVKKEVSRIANRLLFDQNLPATWNRFKSQVVPMLESVKTRLGLSDFKVILDETTTTPDLVDRNIMYAKIFLKPARAIEFIAVDFVITNTGASFDD